MTTTDMMTTDMMTKAIELGGKAWTSRDGSKHRVYLNDWHELVGLDVDYYKSGNVGSIHYKGQHLSNSKGAALLRIQAFVDVDGLHFVKRDDAFNTGLKVDSTVQPVLDQMMADLTAMIEG